MKFDNFKDNNNITKEVNDYIKSKCRKLVINKNITKTKRVLFRSLEELDDFVNENDFELVEAISKYTMSPIDFKQVMSIECKINIKDK